MSPRSFMKPRQPGTLKDAQSTLIDACGGISQARCAVKKSVLQEYADPDKPARNMPLPIVLQLEAQCGVPHVTRFLAGEAGCVVEPIAAPLSEPLQMVMGRITAETGELLSTAAADVQAGRLTKVNAQCVLRETDQLCAAMMELRSAARAVVESP